MVGYFRGFVPERVVLVANALAGAYHRRLNENSLPSRSSLRRGRGAIGGQSSAETLNHLATRFTAGAARAQFVVDDPERRRARPSALVRALLSDGRIAIVDLGCGAGATSLAMLASIAAARQASKLARLPLTVDIVHVDYCSTALALYGHSLRDLTPHLRNSAIEVASVVSIEADLLSPDVDRARIRKAVLDTATQSDATLLAIGALSGTLTNAGSSDPLRTTPVNDLLHALAAQNQAAVSIWIEPGKDYGDGRKMMERLAGTLAGAVGLATTTTEDLHATFLVLDPCDPDVFVHRASLHATHILNSTWFTP